MVTVRRFFLGFLGEFDFGRLVHAYSFKIKKMVVLLTVRRCPLRRLTC